MAHARATGASRARNDRTVMKTVSSTRTVTSEPIAENTIPSKAVSLLKWEATPRHFCMDTRKTSASDATAKVPITSQPTDFLGRRKDMNQDTVARVIPNDSPNTTGLRQDTGPSHGPPSTRKTPRWNSPLARRRPEHTYAKRW